MLQGEPKIKNENMEQKLVTPIGHAKFPRISSPDTKFDADGVFSVDLVLDESSAMELKKDIDSFVSNAYGHYKKVKGVSKELKMANHILKEELDSEGNKTGNFVVRAKAKAKFVSSIPVLDAQDGASPTDKLVTAGSKIVLNTTIASYFTGTIGFGVTLRLNAVLLLEQGQMSSSSQAERMFGKELINAYKDTEIDL